MSSTDPYDEDDRTYAEEVYEEDVYGDDEAYGGGPHEDAYADKEDDGGFLGESLALILFVVGIALFLFPEPATSTLGLILMGAGVLVWAADALL